MMTIWKFPIAVTDEQTVEMPADARILTVQVQHDQPCLWAIVDSDKPTEPRRIRIFGTGHDMGRGNGSVYIGSFQISGGSLVFHVFDQG